MTGHPRLIAEVPEPFRRQGVRWLVLQYAPETGGWFLFGHESRESPSEFDNWYEDPAIARIQALEDWGVTSEAWQTLDD